IGTFAKSIGNTAEMRKEQPSPTPENTRCPMRRTKRVRHRRRMVVSGIIPIGDPLPDVSGYIVETVTIRGVYTHRSRPVAVVIVGLTWINLISPRIEFPFQASSGSAFPLSFCG